MYHLASHAIAMLIDSMIRLRQLHESPPSKNKMNKLLFFEWIKRHLKIHNNGTDPGATTTSYSDRLFVG
jgi:hypothetical protein